MRGKPRIILSVCKSTGERAVMKTPYFLALVTFLLCFYAFHAGAKDRQEPAASVTVTTARIRPLSDQVEALGTLQANETITVTSTVSEIVTAVNFSDGQRVEKGDVLIEMASGEEKAQLDQAQAVIAEAKQQLDRIRMLAKEGVAPQTTLDQRQRDYDAAQGRLREVKSKLKDYLITAPFSGVLGLRNISAGALVQPGIKITTLDDDSVMKLDFSVPSVFLAELKVGTSITAHAREFKDREFKGVVASLDSQIDPVTRSIVVRAILPNEDHILKPGLLMSVNLFSNPRKSIVIPEESLIPEGTQNYVLVIDMSKSPPVAEKRKIIIGARQAGTVEILSGLSEGEKIVTRGTMIARAGQPVTVLAEEEGGESLSSLLEKGAKTQAQPAPEGAAR